MYQSPDGAKVLQELIFRIGEKEKEKYQSPDGAKVLQDDKKKVHSYTWVIEYQSPDGAKVLQD